MSNDQLILNSKLFTAMRKKPNQITEAARRDKVKKHLIAGAGINVQDKNDQNNTVLHIAVKNNYQEIVKFLLAKGARIDMANSEGKTPLNLAQDQQNQDLIKILSKSINVPADGNCLFWAVALAFLTPAKDDDCMFEHRFESLFGKDNEQHSYKLQEVRQSIQNYNPFVSQQDIVQKTVFNNLVTHQFRDRVVRHMRAKKNDFRESIPSDCNQYLNGMQTPGEWGGELEIKAMSQMLDIKIQVHSKTTSCYGSGNELIELYHEGLGGDHRNHYNFGVDVKLKRDQLTFDTPSLTTKIDVIDSKSNPESILPHEHEYAASGLKSSLHGAIYQLKLLILFLQRGLAQGYAFRLATEMDAAEKFDDLVLQYEKTDNRGTKLRDSEGKVINVYRFLQAKHKQDESKKITYNDLSPKNTNGEFSLPKYFASYRKIKENPEFRDSELKDFIIYTNIDFDFDSLSKNEVQTTEIAAADEFLKMKNPGKIAKRYQLKVSDEHKLYDKLRSTSELHMLAKELFKHIKDKKQMGLSSPIFKSYHVALVQEKVIVVEKNEKNKRIGKFHEKFKLRKFYQKHWDEHGGSAIDENMEFSLSDTFGKADTQLCNVADFVQELILLMKNGVGMKDRVEVTIDRQHSKIRANIDTLAQHVLEEKDEKLQFSGKFLDLNIELPGNLGDFRHVFKNKLEEKEIEWYKLGQYEFKINCLPADHVDDQEITNFFDKLVFAVNQPNEMELREILKSEIGMNFNLIDSDFCADYILREMLDWFKDKKGTFFSNDLGEELMESARQKISKKILISSKLEYCAKAKEFGIEFTEDSVDELQLHTFLAPDNKIPIFYLVTAQITLSAIKVCQVLQRMPEYKPDDSFIFLRQECLLRRQDDVIRAFQSDTRHLLVIECEENVKKVDEIQQFLAELKSKTNTNKKIVVITNQKDSFKKMCIDNTHNFTDLTHNFTDLTEISQKKLLEASMLTFQGFGVRLDDLINEESKKIIDPHTLVKLINKHEVTISKPLASLGNTEVYYIDRTLNYQLKMRKELLIEEEKEDEDLYAITDIDKEDLSKLIGKKHEICLFQDYDPDNNKRFIILDPPKAAAQFRQLCQRENQKRNIHLLKAESRQIIWQQSRGRISRLRKYMNKEESDTQHLSETELLNHTQSSQSKVVIISDSAGMGKSTLLTKLAKEIKKTDPTLWLVRINLNDHTKLLEAQGGHKDRNVKEALEFLEKDLLRLVEPSLEQGLFKFYYQKVIVIFDGFDEISPDYRETVIDLLQALKKSTIKQLWVATRPNERVLLEDQLTQFAYTLTPLSADNQIQFLRKFWQQKLEKTPHDEEKLLAYAKALIELFARSISDRHNKFTGIPLQTRMLAEAFEKDAEFLAKNPGEDIENLPEKLNLIDLYERFFAQKYMIYQEEKSKIDRSNLKAKMQSDMYYPSFIRQHQILALRTLFNESDVKILLTGEYPQDESSLIDDNTGIIERGLENKPGFIHRTFAEYLAAKYIVAILAKETIVRFVVEVILLRNDFEVIRAFFNDQLAKETLSESTLKRYGQEIITLWRKSKDENAMILHLAVREHNTDIIKFVLAGLRTDENTLKNFLNSSSNDYGPTPLHSAAENNYWEIVRLLVEHGANVNDKGYNGFTPLHNAVEDDNIDMIQFLVEHGADVDTKSFGEEFPLLLAVKAGKLDIVELLLDHGASVNAVDRRERTALYYAANFEMVQFLVNNGATVKVVDIYGVTVLHEAARYGKPDIVQYLVEQGADVKAKDKDGNTVLHHGAFVGLGGEPLSLVKLIKQRGVDMEAKNNNGDTALHVAADQGNSVLVQCLVEQGADVNATEKGGNTVLHLGALRGLGGEPISLVELIKHRGVDMDAKNNNGQSALHVAAKYGKPDIVQYLVEQGADVKAKDKDGNTVLHYGALRGLGGEPNSLVKLIKHRGVDMDAKNNNGQSALHVAAKYGKPDIVQYLVEQGADVKAKDKDGNTVLHYGALRGLGGEPNSLVKLIKQRGVDMEAKNNNGDTALHVAAKYGKPDIVQYLVEQGAAVKAKDKYGNTVLHLGAWRGLGGEPLSLVELIKHRGVDMDAKNDYGKTALHLAAYDGDSELVQCLVEQGADVNAKDSDGNTVLHHGAYGGLGGESISLVELIKHRGVDMEAKNNNGDTALHVAAGQGNSVLVQCLVEQGADVNATEKGGNTVLHLGALRGLGGEPISLVELIKHRGVDMDAKNNNGQSALHVAAKYGKPDIVQYLVEQGADVKAKDKYGNTVLHKAASSGSLKTVQYLMEQGADVNAKDNDGHTPVDYAISKSVIKYLKNQAADVKDADKLDLVPAFQI